jgi:hypothetical protein
LSHRLLLRLPVLLLLLLPLPLLLLLLSRCRCCCCCCRHAGLSLLSIFFDVLFMIQHYVLYPEHSRRKAGAAAPKEKDDHSLTNVLLEDASNTNDA